MNPISPSIGPLGDGLPHGTLPLVAPVAAVSSVASITGGRVLWGDAQSTSILWQDVTASAQDLAAPSFTLFNGDGDKLRITLASDDIIESIDAYLPGIAVYTGNLSMDIRWRDANGNDVNHSGLACPDCKTAGIKRFLLPETLDYASIGQFDDPLNNTRQKAVEITFHVGTVTTAPQAAQLWRRRTASAPRIITEYTAMVTQGETPDMTPYTGIQFLPLTGDVSVVGFDAPFARLISRMYRGFPVDAGVKPAYSTASGIVDATFAVVALGSSNAGGPWSRGPVAPATMIECIDTIVPPADWDRYNIKVGGTDHNLYWWGRLHTADAAAPSPIALATIRGQPFVGAGVVPVDTEPTAGTWTTIQTRFEEPGVATRLLLANTTSGKSASISLADNVRAADAAISLARSAGDGVIIQILGGGVPGPAFGWMDVD